MASKKANRYVTVGGQTFAPGEPIPGDLAKLIDNPKVWDAEESVSDAAKPKAVEKKN